MRAIQVIAILLAVLIVILCGSLPYLEKTQIGRWNKQAPNSLIKLLNPVFDQPQRAFVESWLLGQKADSAMVLEAAQQATDARPLSGLNWFNRAKVEYRIGDKQLASRYALHAETLAPTRAQHLWNLAMYWLKAGDVQQYFRLIRTYLLAKPNDVNKVLTLSSRLQQDPNRLLSSIFPEIQLLPKQKDHYLFQIIRFAISSKNQPLAEVAWEKISNKTYAGSSNQRVTKAYMQFLISNGFVHEARQLSKQTLEEKSPFERIYNNGFEQRLKNFGFSWFTRNINGGRIERDSYNKVEGDYSLSVVFDGTENMNLYAPYITISVEPDIEYQITAFWKGNAVTTRSNPYIEVHSLGAEKNVQVRSAAKRGSWDWQRVKLRLKMPNDSSLLKIRLRRNKTSALDKNISGKIWLDDFKIERIQQRNN